eukprot:s125_g31.t1
MGTGGRSKVCGKTRPWIGQVGAPGAERSQKDADGDGWGALGGERVRGDTVTDGDGWGEFWVPSGEDAVMDGDRIFVKGRGRGRGRVGQARTTERPREDGDGNEWEFWVPRCAERGGYGWE